MWCVEEELFFAQTHINKVVGSFDISSSSGVCAVVVMDLLVNSTLETQFRVRLVLKSLVYETAFFMAPPAGVSRESRCIPVLIRGGFCFWNPAR
jgi:hypothetical protein